MREVERGTRRCLVALSVVLLGCASDTRTRGEREAAADLPGALGTARDDAPAKPRCAEPPVTLRTGELPASVATDGLTLTVTEIAGAYEVTACRVANEDLPAWVSADGPLFDVWYVESAATELSLHTEQ